MQKTYPKVPNHYHDSVEESFFTAEDLLVIEKVDGSNTRILVYDEQFDDVYGEKIMSFDPVDGDVFIGTKNVVRGKITDSLESFDAVFHRLIKHLRAELNVDTVKSYHHDYDSPLLLFGENMVKHSLDYGYGQSPPPALLGFDAYQLKQYEHPPSNPFDERFDGFLPWNEAKEVFEESGLDVLPVLEQFTPPVKVDHIDVPISSFANVKAEGIVFRSDSRNRRVKFVSEEFRERAREAWGMREDEAESGEELFLSRYITNPRLRKTVNKLLYEYSIDEITPRMVADAAVADAWEEELDEIKSIGLEFTPVDIIDLAEPRAEAVMDTMQTNAALNDASLDELWEEFQGSDSTDNVSVGFDVNGDEVEDLVQVMQKQDNKHAALVQHYISSAEVIRTGETIADNNGDEFGNWVIPNINDTLQDELWYDNVGVIANLPVSITPADVNSSLIAFIASIIEQQTA